MLLHEEEEDEEDEDEESVKSCFTCIPYLVFQFFCMQLLFYMFFTLMSLKDRLRLKLKVKTKRSLCMAIMLDNPWQSLYTVEPPNNGQIGSRTFVLYMEVVPFRKQRQTRPITSNN